MFTSEFTLLCNRPRHRDVGAGPTCHGPLGADKFAQFGLKYQYLQKGYTFCRIELSEVFRGHGAMVPLA